jgi:thioredoxin 1
MSDVAKTGSAAKPLRDQEFTSKVLNNEGYVLIDFWAEWCGPCRQLSPIVEEVAKELEGKVECFKMNVDENPETPTSFGVKGIPTVMLFRDGKLIATNVGALPKEALMQWIKSEIED